MEDRILDLVSKLEQVSRFVWIEAVQQSTVTGYYYLVKEFIILLILILSIIFETYLIKSEKLERDKSDGWAFLFIILIIITIIATIGFVITLYPTITHLMNPEWGAILILKDLISE